MRRILVLGIGDIGSAVAHLLFRAGQLVVIQDEPRPVSSRRRMAFVDAMFDGEAQLTGVIARLVRPAALSRSTWSIRFIPVTSTAPALAVERLAPDVIVDARMDKRTKPARLRGLAPLVIGLGPGFVAGGNVDVAVETSPDNPGRILRRGPTPPSKGEARTSRGRAQDGYAYAPAAGVFSSKHDIGDVVARGETIARIGRQTIKAPLSGHLRGLSRSGLPVAKGATILEVVPIGADEKIVGVDIRPRRIAEAVLALVRERRDYSGSIPANRTISA